MSGSYPEYDDALYSKAFSELPRTPSMSVTLSPKFSHGLVVDRYKSLDLRKVDFKSSRRLIQ